MTADIIKPISVTRLELHIKIPTVQSDTGRRIIFVMTDLDIPDGGTAQIYAKKPSGAEIYNNCTVGNLPTGASTVTVQLTSAMLEEAGDFMAQIQVVSGNDVVTSFVFTISNAKNLVNDSAAEGSNEYNALVEATQEALDAAQEALDAAAQVGDISSKTVTFQQAAQRANIQSGDTLAVAFGKLAKYCADLKEAAYQGTANNLTTTEEGKVLDARQGKELKDQIGDLDELETSEKENLVGAVNELNTNLQSIFSAERNDNDYNLITTPGFYNCTSASHAPFTAGEWTVMLVLNYPGSTVAQIAFSVSTGKSAVRIGATSAWKTF